MVDTEHNYQDLCKRIKALEEEIHSSRVLNTDQHDTILTNAKESAELAEKVDSIIEKWQHFWSVIMMLRNIFFTVGFLYILASLIINWGDAIGAISGA